MRIDGITTCVGELYAGYLRRTLPVWLHTLDSLTIVTDEKGSPSLWSLALFSAKIVHTDVFTADGALFNKGGALNVGYDVAAPSDWVLSFDADILPPDDWRERAERRARCGALNGAHRRQVGQREPIRRAISCKGYFQLWHVADRHYRRRPIFDDTIDAGGYDTAFASQWPKARHNNLGFTVTHLGERCRYWCGPATSPQERREALLRFRNRKEEQLARRAKRA